MNPTRRFPGRIAPFVAGLAIAASSLSGEVIRNHFDTDSVMRTPGFMDFFVLGAPGPARWIILTDDNPPSAPNRIAQVEGRRPAESVATAVRRNHVFQDGTVSTFVKRGPGTAGLLLRMADEKNVLVLLLNTATGEAVLSSYRDGTPTELGRGRATLARQWEKIAVTASGPVLSVFFNEEKLFQATDPRPASGRVGLATAGPGEASFDELILAPAKPGGP